MIMSSTMSAADCVADSANAAGRSLQVEGLEGGASIVVASQALKEVCARVDLMASVCVPILVLGETGTGKDMIARLIHKLSPRSHRTFYKVNCAAVPDELLESELFGYEAGAFTGATRMKPGRFEMCEGGTLYLDEIGEMSPRLQAKLLHVLQDKTFCRLGGRLTVTVDVRFVAATNVDIGDAIATGKLREDLYYRLSGFTIPLPPLRERKEEIPFLFRHFMDRFAAQYRLNPRCSPPVLMEACMSYSWPGNVRELENFVRRYLIIGDDGAALAEMKSGFSAGCPAVETLKPFLAEDPGRGLKSRVRSFKRGIEVEAILEALEQTHWNRTRAAELLSISSRSLRSKMTDYGICYAKSHAHGLPD